MNRALCNKMRLLYLKTGQKDNFPSMWGRKIFKKEKHMTNHKKVPNKASRTKPEPTNNWFRLSGQTCCIPRRSGSVRLDRTNSSKTGEAMGGIYQPVTEQREYGRVSGPRWSSIMGCGMEKDGSSGSSWITVWSQQNIWPGLVKGA